MKTILPAQAEQQLTHVADRFDAWRQTRTTRATPLPQHLWEQAIAFTALCPMTHVARRLRVSGGELKKRCAAHHAARSTPALPALGFMEVTAPSVWPSPTTGTEIELHRADGTRLRMHSHEPQPPLVPTFRTSVSDLSHFCVLLEVLYNLLTLRGDCYARPSHGP
jgi:hypothetical protein